MSATDTAATGSAKRQAKPKAVGETSFLRKLAAKLAPHGSFQDRCRRGVAKKLRHLRCRFSCPAGLDLEQVLRETEGRKGIVVYPPFIDWNWMRQRPQHLMAQFAKEGYLSLFCSPRSKVDYFRGFSRIAERLYLCDAVEPLFGLPKPIVLTGWTGHWGVVERFRAPLLIYDYLDDLGVSSHGGAIDQRKLELHQELAARADVVLATARRLYEEMRHVRPDTLFCPNGADYEHFHFDASKKTPSPPEDIADLVAAGRPIIGYYGALARWFDFDLVRQAAAERPDYAFVLIGSDIDDTVHRKPDFWLPNVRWLGERSYDALPAYLYYFSVATIPFQINDITKATSPVKLYEYMAGGRPIVTTDMPECRAFESVLIAHDAAEFIAKLDDAIVRGGREAYRQQLDHDAKSNTWTARAKQILDQVEHIIATPHVAPASHSVPGWHRKKESED